MLNFVEVGLIVTFDEGYNYRLSSVLSPRGTSESYQHRWSPDLLAGIKFLQ